MIHELCWLAQNGRMEHDDPMPGCEGRLIRAHLIPQRWLKQEGKGSPGDPRSYVWACGGIMGNAGHHGMFDYQRTLRVAVEDMPRATLALAEELGLYEKLVAYYERRS